MPDLLGSSFDVRMKNAVGYRAVTGRDADANLGGRLFSGSVMAREPAARIRRLTLLPLDASGEAPANDGPLRLQAWKKAVASCFNYAALADPARIHDCMLENLSATTDEH